MDIKLNIIEKEKKFSIQTSKDKSIMDALLENNIKINAPCNGKGNCGKCKVKILSGKVKLNKNNYEKLTQEEIDKGVCLACSSYVQEECTINIDYLKEEGFEVLSQYKLQKQGFRDINFTDAAVGLGIDIGTTTIVISLIDLRRGQAINSYSMLNSQRKFGADVISRIQYSCEGNVEELRQCVCSDILNGINELFKTLNSQDKKYELSNIYNIVIAGNTTMLYMLLGLNCNSLAQYPFTTILTSLMEYDFEEIFHNTDINCKVIILPGKSAYVGSDVVSGMLNCGFHKSEKINMLIDIGTNGEIVIGNKNEILCTAVAAGPAFEGVNITCGTGSVKGAISEVNITSGQITYKTIKNSSPVGICGSGVIDVTATCIKNNIIDATGKFNEEDCNDRFIEIAKDELGQPIIFNQKDVRELQLAKAAISAGIQVLIKRYGCNYKDIDKVYIAGGFGNKINIDNAIQIGLIPKEFKVKVDFIGNSSLGGAVQYLIDIDNRREIENILNICEDIDLALNSEFNDLFIKNMMF